jgi:hypothetical protein
MALLAKITPKRVEGTMFAILTGIWNFADKVISPMIGTKINSLFVGVTENNLQKYSTLVLF